MAEVGFSAIDKNSTIRDRHFELMLSGIRFVLEPMRLSIDIDGHQPQSFHEFQIYRIIGQVHEFEINLF